MEITYAFTHSIEVDVSAEAVWSLYEDLDTSSRWDPEVLRVTRDRPLMITADFAETMVSLAACAAERST